MSLSRYIFAVTAVTAEIFGRVGIFLRWKYAELCGPCMAQGWVLVVRDRVLYGLSQVKARESG